MKSVEQLKEDIIKLEHANEIMDNLLIILKKYRTNEDKIIDNGTDQG